MPPEPRWYCSSPPVAGANESGSATASFEEFYEKARAEHAEFVRAYHDISNRYEAANPENKALLDAYLEADREYEAATRAYEEASLRLGWTLYNNQAVQDAKRDYKRTMNQASLAERVNNSGRARQLRERAKTDYKAAFESAIDGTPMPGYMDAERTAYKRLEDAEAARFEARRSLASRSNE